MNVKGIKMIHVKYNYVLCSYLGQHNYMVSPNVTIEKGYYTSLFATCGGYFCLHVYSEGEEEMICGAATNHLFLTLTP